MRFLAFDLGDKRTGVASGDSELGVVSPLRVIEAPMDAGDRLLDELSRVIAEHRPAAVVVGLPLNMDDDSEGPQARKVRAFARRLEERAALAVHLQDERLTSAAADWQLAGSGLTHGQKKQRRDALAAAEILREFFSRLAQERRDAAGGEPPPPPTPPSGWGPST
ncbi:MAG: Holliday junction resolvase RuvX [Planctomycetota bacterium]|nr:Holliday junction resolvase RuvX [Planctomycetota bacterium]